MRFLLACLLALSALRLLWPALSSPLPDKSNNGEKSLIPYPAQTALAPVEAVYERETSQQPNDCTWLDSCVISLGDPDDTYDDGVCAGLPDGVPAAGCPEKPIDDCPDGECDTETLPSRTPLQVAGDYMCLGSFCNSIRDPDDFCRDGGCSESADGVITCGCPKKPANDCTGPGCNGDPVVSAKYPKTSSYGTKPALNWAGDVIRSSGIVVCNSAFLLCVQPRDGSFCTDMLYFDERNNGLECSCPNGTITSWADETPEMAEMTDKWFSEHDPIEDSWVSSTVSVEEAAISSTATSLVKRTKEPCPNPKVNPYPPFNFICPGDDDDDGGDH